MIAEFGADHVLLATGAPWRDDGAGRTRLLEIPGFAGSALTPDDLMAKAPVEGPVVIYDDDHYYMANALAADLASKGHAVHIVSPQPTIAPWMGHTLEQPRMIAELLAAGVQMSPNATAVAWHGDRLSLVRSDTGEALPDIPARTLVFVGTRLPDLSLAAQLDQRGHSLSDHRRCRMSRRDARRCLFRSSPCARNPWVRTCRPDIPARKTNAVSLRPPSRSPFQGAQTCRRQIALSHW